MTAVIVIASLLAGFALFGGMIYALIRHSKKHTQHRQAVAADFAREMDRLGVREQLAWRIDRSGQHYTAGVAQHSKSPPTYWIHATIKERARQAGTPFRATGDQVLPRLPRLLLRRERRPDRLGKLLRLNREVQTGDPRFDGTVYVESDATDDEVLAVLAAPRARNAVIALLDFGVHELTLNHDHQQLRIHWQHGAMTAHSQLDGILAALDDFVSELPSFADVSIDHSWMRGTGFVTASVLVLLASFVLLAVSFNVYPPIDNSDTAPYVLGGCAVWLAVCAACWIRVAGTSNALRYFAWTLAVGSFAFPLFAMGGTNTINGVFDSDLREVRVHGVRTTMNTGGKSTTYSLHVDPWPPHRHEIKLRIDADDYHQLEHPDATLRIGRGALGIEWFDEIVSYR